LYASCSDFSTAQGERLSILRDYQQKLKAELNDRWRAGETNVLCVLPTGGGKTVVIADVARDEPRPSRIIAHRQELVGQISMSMARAGLQHNIIAPQNVIRFVVERHVEQLGRSFFHSGAPAAVAGVDTLLKRQDPQAAQVQLWQTDEAHHLLRANKWGKVCDFYPRARGAGWTATPCRADGRKLTRSSGEGVFDGLVVGPSMRELIDRGHLSRYDVIGPRASIDRSTLEVSKSTGDFLVPGMRDQAHRSTIVGDVVHTYLRFTPGQLGITFAVDQGMAEEHAEAFRHFGVPAQVITYKTDPKMRVQWMREFEQGLLKQLVSVDIFGEGTDVPGLRVVSMARPTESFPYYVQMFGRPLRTAPGKTHGTIIDHVGNLKHGLPDGIETWSIEGDPVRRNGSRSTPVRTCENPDCFRAFESYSLTCPWCGWRPTPAPARRPEMVEGDLTVYGPELLEELRKAAALAMAGPPDRKPQSGRDVVIDRNMVARQAAQQDLRDAMAWWAGVRRDVHGDDDSTSYRRFYHTFGIDAYSAITLAGPKALELAGKIREDMYR
jgi:DNA repair protein RadD